MSARSRLLLEAGALLRIASSPVARKAAAREAAQLTIGDLAAATEDQSRIYLAIREIVIAIAIAPDHRRGHLVAALESLVVAARAEPTQVQLQRPRGEPRLYWIGANR